MIIGIGSQGPGTSYIGSAVLGRPRTKFENGGHQQWKTQALKSFLRWTEEESRNFYAVGSRVQVYSLHQY